MDIKILVATHKKYWMPADRVYVPIQVGKEGKPDLGFLGDNTGENISLKNPSYCELTGLYWAWKNLKCDYVGLCHYRRYFGHTYLVSTICNKKSKIFKYEDYEMILKDYDIILPKPIDFKNIDIRNQYIDCHYKEDLDAIENIVKSIYPHYIDDFESTMKCNKLFAYNMFVMKKNNFDDYAEWLFEILFRFERDNDMQKYDQYQSRVYGFLSERLFNVWVRKQGYKVKYVPCLNLEQEDMSTVERIIQFLKS